MDSPAGPAAAAVLRRLALNISREQPEDDNPDDSQQVEIDELPYIARLAAIPRLALCSAHS